MTFILMNIVLHVHTEKWNIEAEHKIIRISLPVEECGVTGHQKQYRQLIIINIPREYIIYYATYTIT